MVKGKNEWGKQTLACSPFETRITRTSTEASWSPLVASEGACLNCGTTAGRRQDSRGCSKEAVGELLMPSVSGIVSWGARSAENKHILCFKKSVANGENRHRHPYSDAGEKIVLSYERIYRGRKGYLQQ